MSSQRTGILGLVGRLKGFALNLVKEWQMPLHDFCDEPQRILLRRITRPDVPDAGCVNREPVKAMIDGVSGAWVTRADRRRSSGSTGAGFSVPAEPASGPESAPATGSTSATLMDAMLLLQENDPVLERDRKARRHGQSMLAALAALQRALISGGGDGVALDRLAELMSALPHTVDPALASVISAIKLRAAVELARCGR